MKLGFIIQILEALACRFLSLGMQILEVLAAQVCFSTTHTLTSTNRPTLTPTNRHSNAHKPRKTVAPTVYSNAHKPPDNCGSYSFSTVTPTIFMPTPTSRPSTRPQTAKTWTPTIFMLDSSYSFDARNVTEIYCSQIFYWV